MVTERSAIAQGPGDHIVQPNSTLLEIGIADRMAVNIVDLFEIIQINKDKQSGGRTVI